MDSSVTTSVPTTSSRFPAQYTQLPKNSNGIFERGYRIVSWNPDSAASNPKIELQPNQKLLTQLPKQAESDGGRDCRIYAGRALSSFTDKFALNSSETLVGVAVTTHEQDGTLQRFLAAWAVNNLQLLAISYTPSSLTLEEEDHILEAGLIWCVEAATIGTKIADFVLPPELNGKATVSSWSNSIKDALLQVQNGTYPYFRIDESGEIFLGASLDTQRPKILVGGSFNPLHDGHVSMLQVAREHEVEKYEDKNNSSEKMTSQGHISHLEALPLCGFEFTVTNADKGSTDTALLRLAQFAGRFNVFLTNAPTFVQKSNSLLHTTFVVGYDTAVRIIMPKYYGDTVEGLCAALSALQSNLCHFLVAGRLDPVDGSFKSLKDMQFLPGSEQFANMFDEIPESKFRADISSTQLRKQASVESQKK